MKPGYLTTEFWLTVVVAASALVKSFTGHNVGDSETIAEAIAGAATGIYTIARVVQKAMQTSAPVTYSTIATSPAAALVQQLAATPAVVPSQPVSSAASAPVSTTIDAPQASDLVA